MPLLFLVHDDPAEEAAMLRFRCGPVHGQHGTKTNYCHKLNRLSTIMSHYRGLSDVALNSGLGMNGGGCSLCAVLSAVVSHSQLYRHGYMRATDVQPA